MKCPYCGEYLHIGSAIKGRIRNNPVTIIHTCGKEVTITKEDYNEYLKIRLGRLSRKKETE